MKTALVAMGVAAVAGGCTAHHFIYSRADRVGTAPVAYAKDRQPIPSEAPTGAVVTSSGGIVDVSSDKRAETARLLHVRMVVSNERDDAPWTIDARAQLARIPGQKESHPVFLGSDDDGAPMFAVTRGQTRTLDLYYAIPEAMKTELTLPGFEFAWQVKTATRLATGTTPFVRFLLDPDVADAYVLPLSAPLQWGGHWWYDPADPTLAMIHPTILWYRNPARRVYVGPAPQVR